MMIFVGCIPDKDICKDIPPPPPLIIQKNIFPPADSKAHGRGGGYICLKTSTHTMPADMQFFFTNFSYIV